MAWRLEIHHIGLTTRGDATLVFAKNRDTGVTRSALIDGGLQKCAPEVDRYLARTLKNPKTGVAVALDVMVATHYDTDHCGGLTGLLLLKHDRYKRARIYDQGWLGPDTPKTSP